VLGRSRQLDQVGTQPLRCRFHLLLKPVFRPSDRDLLAPVRADPCPSMAGNSEFQGGRPVVATHNPWAEQVRIGGDIILQRRGEPGTTMSVAKKNVIISRTVKSWPPHRGRQHSLRFMHDTYPMHCKADNTSPRAVPKYTGVPTNSSSAPRITARPVAVDPKMPDHHPAAPRRRRCRAAWARNCA